MCSMDDRDLRLELVKWESQRAQYERQHREAMATGNRASMRIVGEQVNQAAAQVALLNEQISRAKITAPFQGVVVTGDLSQLLGSPVERGKVLFEVAPSGKLPGPDPGQRAGHFLDQGRPERPYGAQFPSGTHVPRHCRKNNAGFNCHRGQQLLSCGGNRAGGVRAAAPRHGGRQQNRNRQEEAFLDTDARSHRLDSPLAVVVAARKFPMLLKMQEGTQNL